MQQRREGEQRLTLCLSARLPPRRRSRLAAHSLVVRDPAYELRAGVNVELAVDVRQVKLDRLRAEEERRCDVAIGLAVRDEARDLQLLLRHLLLRGRLTPTQGKP